MALRSPQWGRGSWLLCLFVFYGPVNPMGSCRAGSVYLGTPLLVRLNSKRLTSIVHVLSPETDNCPSWISGRERMTIENISRSISTKECCRPQRGSNPRPPGLQLNPHPTEPPRPEAGYFTLVCGLCAICCGLFALPFGVIGRLCSVIVALPGHLYYILWSLARVQK